MTTRKQEDRGTRRRGRARGDEGAALIEFVFVSVLLLTLLFGILNFGLIMSVDQDVTRAAAEGARGGAVAVPTSLGNTTAAQVAATSAVNDAVKQMGDHFEGAGCNTTGMHCVPPVVIDCPEQPSYKCVKVEIYYEYKDHPIFGDLPIVNIFFPEQLRATSIARINQ